MSLMGKIVHNLPPWLRDRVERVRYVALVMWNLRGRHRRTCPICDYSGYFRAFGFPPSFDAMCPRCESLERHRLLHLISSRETLFRSSDRMLHFAPEKALEPVFKERVREYVTADLHRKDVDVVLSIEELDPLPDESFDVALASHVLEHVDDDRKAIAELRRVLKPEGRLVLMVPVVEGWERTYEDADGADEVNLDLHFGQKDHQRLYGRDLNNRISEAGFDVQAFMATPADCAEYGLIRGEKVFVGIKRRQHPEARD